MASEKERANSLGLTDLRELTEQAVRLHSQVVFAGFLVKQDDDAVYIADPQGTWVVSRQDIEHIGDWNAESVPQTRRSQGEPVTVAVRDGATIFEIRPWKLTRTPGGMGPEARKIVDRVFSLGGAPLPISDRGVAGEEQMAELERGFARRLGWDPSDPGGSPIGRNADMRRSHVSKTIEINDGYTDTDDGF